MIKVEAVGHNGGDPAKFCEKLTMEAGNWADARAVALLNRVLDDREMRTRLLDAADRIEQEQLEAAAQYAGARHSE